MVFIVITNLITLYALHETPNLSRLLSTGVDIKFNTIGIASYFYMYGIIYFILAFLGIVFYGKKMGGKKHITKISILLSMLMLCLYTIYKAEFTISILLLCLGIIIILLKIDNFKKLFLTQVALLIIILICAKPVSNLFYKMADKTDSPNYKMRYSEIAHFIGTGDINETIDLKARLNLYLISANTFFHNPMFGVGFNKITGEIKSIGNHSTLLDELARYGIVGTLPLMAVITILFYKIYNLLENKYQRRVYFSCICVFSVFLIINTALFVTIFTMLFVITPAIIYLYVGTDENIVYLKEGIENHENIMDC
jgi:O-antigen ligase